LKPLEIRPQASPAAKHGYKNLQTRNDGMSLRAMPHVLVNSILNQPAACVQDIASQKTLVPLIGRLSGLRRHKFAVISRPQVFV
jgi:hypothetical protein